MHLSNELSELQEAECKKKKKKEVESSPLKIMFCCTEAVILSELQLQAHFL